jgi:hypothetical protein
MQTYTSYTFIVVLDPSYKFNGQKNIDLDNAQFEPVTISRNDPSEAAYVAAVRNAYNGPAIVYPIRNGHVPEMEMLDALNSLPDIGDPIEGTVQSVV